LHLGYQAGELARNLEELRDQLRPDEAAALRHLRRLKHDAEETRRSRR
jgi:hypothetical protein